jgi:BACON domain-containing protein
MMSQFTLNPASLAFNVVKNGPAQTRSLTITKVGGGRLKWTISVASTIVSMSVLPTSGSNTATVAVTVHPGPTAPGTYGALITVSSKTQQQTVPVTITVSQPTSTATSTGSPVSTSTGAPFTANEQFMVYPAPVPHPYRLPIRVNS